MIPLHRRRLIVLYVLTVAMLAVLGGRLWYVQVMNGPQFKTLAAQSQTRTIVVPALRGEILDDEGDAFVTNQTSLVISVNMMQLSQQPDGGSAVLRQLGQLLGISYSVLKAKTTLCTQGVKPPCWSGSPYQPIPVDEHVSGQVALQIMEEPKVYVGVTAQVQPVTYYPSPDGADPAQVLGYLQPITSAEVASRHLTVTGFSGVDLVGQAGLEAEYDQQLRGVPGSQTVSVNAAGDVTGTQGQVAAKPGDDLVTSINAKIQVVAQNALNSAIAKSRASGNDVGQGAAVVETTSGRIVAMASYPDYNPNIWTNGITESEFNTLFGPANSTGSASSGAPVLNYDTQGQYSPGSTFKIVSTAVAVNNGYSINGQYNCPASYKIDGHSYADDGEPDMGPISFQQALIVSCDTVYYEIGYQMWRADNQSADFKANPNGPVQKMQAGELAWGFGKSTGIDLPSEASGTIPTRQWLYWLWKDNADKGQQWCKNGKKNGSYVQQIEYQDCQSGYMWEPGLAAIAAIGQGYISATPLQLANAYVALANGGTLYSPRIGEALVTTSGQLVQSINPPVLSHVPASASTLAYIRNALAGVVTQGTAQGAFGGFPLGKVCVAGKTGTAESFGSKSTSVFASFAPCNNPQYVVVVMLPDSGYGADSAAPAVRQIYDGIYGLEGQKAAVASGRVPTGLPKMKRAGIIVPKKPTPHKTAATPQATPTATQPAATP
ncbi:MAG TPA: penicillin-binding protein 2 [Trebonia sp.]|nr:penicillin-binding protein 2 [Trebonia sp.]